MPYLRGMMRSSLLGILVNVLILSSGTSGQNSTSEVATNNTTTSVLNSTTVVTTNYTTPSGQNTTSEVATNNTTPSVLNSTTVVTTNYTTPSGQNSTSEVATNNTTPSVLNNTTVVTTNDTTLSPPCPSNLHLTATSTSQEIDSPYYPGNYRNNANCSWLIEAPLNSSLRISISSYSIESHSSCGYDALEIFNGANRYSYRLANLCGQGSYTLTNHEVTEAFVWFHTDGSVTREGFQVTYWTGPLDAQDEASDEQDGQPCDGTPHVLQATPDPQILESPGYPVSYNNRMNCSWTIQFPEGTYLSISLEDFELENHYICGYDSLEIYNVDSSNNRYRLASLCGTKSSGTYNVENEAYLRFRTDYSIVRKGFKLSYEVTTQAPEAQPCGGGVLDVQASESPQTILSPDYPANYPNYENCSWRIQASPDHQIKISLEDFRLENHYSCYYDALEIFDGPNRAATRLAKLCGSLTSKSYGSSSSVMYINFHSDYSVRYRGFNVSYMQVDEYHPACHGQIVSLQAFTTTRSLVSPRYPDSYPNDLECQWLIMTSSSDFLLIVIENLRLQNSTNCSSDALQLFDGNDQYHIQLANLCGEITSGSQEFLSQSPSVFVLFHTDNSQTDTGFNITYQSVDESFLACHRGPLESQVSQYSTKVITSPDYPYYYASNATCQWRVESSLDFVQITRNVFGSSNNFSRVILEIFDGVDDTAPLLVRICDRYPRTTYTSSSKTVFIRFYSTESVRGSRFKLTLKGLDKSHKACVGDEPLELQAELFPQSFTSPNYPTYYPNNARCRWLVRASTPYTKLSLDGHRIEHHRSCYFDALEIFAGPDSGSDQLANLCDFHYSEKVYVSSSNVTYVYFHTDGSVTATGFNLTYQALENYYPGCNGVEQRLSATLDPQSIVSPGYPLAYDNNMTCSWYIQSPSYYRYLSVRVEDINLGNDPDCSQDKLAIEDVNGPIATLCGHNASNSVHGSSRGWMRVRFVSDESTTYPGFRLSYKTEYFQGCHRYTAVLDANSNSKIIESPFYPSNYTNNAYCRWRIYSETGMLRITIEDLSLEFDSNCYMDYLRIREDYYGDVLARACGSESPYLNADIVSYNAYTTVLFHSSSRNTDRGFRLRYQSATPEWIACNTDVPYVVEVDSIWRNIISPNYPETYPEASNCSWLVVSEHDYVIIKVEYLRLPESTSCANSSLEIFEGANQTSPSVARLCGEYSSDSYEFTSSSGMLFIKFSSTGSVTDGGFQLSYKEILLSDLACGGETLELQAEPFAQSFRSPDYPSVYPNNAHCKWRITSPTPYIKLTLDGYRISYHQTCDYDALEIFAGPDSGSTQIAKLCGYSYSEKVFISPSNITYVYFHTNERSASTGFNLAYQALENYHHGCEGEDPTLEATSDLQRFESPGYPVAYDNNMRCRWYIRPNSSYGYVSVFVEDLNLGNDTYCYEDRLLLYGGYPTYTTLCGQDSSNSTVYISNSNWMRVTFYSDESNTYPGFRLAYKTDYFEGCHGLTAWLEANSTSQILQSPFYPSNYPLNAYCGWRIYSETGAILINIEDSSFYDSNCYADYLHIRGVSSFYVTLARVCGRESPYLHADIVSSYWYTAMYFNSGDWGTDRGFRLRYRSVTREWIACHSDGPLRVEADSSWRNITSPNYPDSYPETSNCSWLVVPEGSYVIIKVEYLSLPENSSCADTSLEIFGGASNNSPILARLCGEYSSGSTEVISSSGMVFIQFSSTGSVANGGFQLSYRASSFVHTACLGEPLELRAKNFTQSFTSPNYPSYYPNNAHCEWLIISPTPYTKLSLDRYRIPCSDGLEIFAGPDSGSTQIADLCGYYYSERVYVSSSNVTYVYFNTNGYYTSRGFSLTYQALENYIPGCMEVEQRLDATSEPQSLESHGYPLAYDNNMTCSWYIQSTSYYGYVSIRVEDINLGNDTNCSQDRLEIDDGYSSNVTLCGQDSSNSTVYISARNWIRVRFYSDLSTVYPGFKLSYKREYFEGCHGFTARLIADNTSNIIQSPFYPSNYTNNEYCRWEIYSETGVTLINIEDLSLDFDNDCYKDYLRISEDYTTLARVCGSDSPYLHTDIVSRSAYTAIRFRSDYRGTDRGFRLRYRSATQEWIACHFDGPLRLEAENSWRNITSPNYPGAYPEGSNCSWLIRAYEHFVIIKVEYLRLPESASCANSSLEIFEGNNQTSRSLARLCGEQSSNSSEYILSHNAFIQFSSTGSATDVGFQLKYKAVSFLDIACSDYQVRLQASYETQYIWVDHFPFNHTECFWQIWSPTGYVRATVEYVYFYGETGCSNGHIDIYDGADATFPSLERVCLSNYIFENDSMSTSSSGELFFHLYPTDFSDYSYLFITYIIVDERFPACIGAPLELQATQSPQWIESSTNSSNAICRWRITSEENFVLITIHDLELNCEDSDFLGFLSGNSSMYDYYSYIWRCHEYQGLSPLRTFWSSSNLFSVHFRSSPVPSSRHFRLMYRSVNENFQDACQGNQRFLDSEPYEQSLESPGYPDAYFNYIECTWIISASTYKIVRVVVNDLRLQPDSNCSDYLEIHDDMPYYSFEPLAKLCGGDSVNQTYWSLSSMIHIYFHTDGQNTSNGFRLTYESFDPSYAACMSPPQHLRADRGSNSITSPDYPDTYPNNSNCAWKIEVPAGRILISVWSLHIDNSADCSNEALEIFDGGSPNAVSLIKLCGEHSSSRYISSSEAMYIQFHSDSSSAIMHSGFNLMYYWVSPDYQACFGPPLEVNVNSTLQVHIFSGEDFANASANCAWHLKSDAGFIRVVVAYVFMEESAECDWQALEIFDGANDTSPNLLRTCGYHRHLNLVSYRSTSNEMFLQINYMYYSYFRVLYVNVEPDQACQGQPALLQATSEVKTLESPGYSLSYPNNANCSWEIRAANGSVEIYLIDLKLQRSVGCVDDSLEIFDGPDENAPLLHRLCGNTSTFANSSSLVSSSNVLFLRFHTDNSNTFPGFLLAYGEEYMWLPRFY